MMRPHLLYPQVLRHCKQRVFFLLHSFIHVSGKKYVWFPDKENAYVKGELTKSDGGKCTIKACESGKV